MWVHLIASSALLLATAEATVEDAAAAFDGLDYARAARLCERALAEPDLARPSRIDALRILSEAKIIMGEAAAADAPLSELFRLEPAFSLPADRSPKIQAIFDQVRRRVRTQERGRAIEAIELRDRTSVTFSFEDSLVFELEVRDPKEVIAELRVHYRSHLDMPFEPLQLTVGAAGFWSARLETTSPRIEYFLVARDRADAIVGGLWSESNPRVLSGQKPGSWTTNPWVWSGIGLGVAAGVVAAVLVLNDSDAPDADLRFDL